jgi:hypothetical protein
VGRGLVGWLVGVVVAVEVVGGGVVGRAVDPVVGFVLAVGLVGGVGVAE